MRADLDLDTCDIPESSWPSVDVFIVTYTEPPYILEATLVAAVTMDYPLHLLTVHVLVCDPLTLPACVSAVFWNAQLVSNAPYVLS